MRSRGNTIPPIDQVLSTLRAPHRPLPVPEWDLGCGAYPLIVFLLLSRNLVLSSVLSAVKFKDMVLVPSGGNSILFTCFMVGLFLFILSEVFRAGTSLEEENEMIV